MQESLVWEINPTDFRKRHFVYFFLTWVVLLVVFVAFFFPVVLAIPQDAQITYRQWFMWSVAISIILGIAIVVNKFFPYKKHVYSIEPSRLKVVKGSKEEVYQWSSFSFFTEETSSSSGSSALGFNLGRFLLRFLLGWLIRDVADYFKFDKRNFELAVKGSSKKVLLITRDKENFQVVDKVLCSYLEKRGVGR